jgi:hypothetical protein
VFSKIEVVLLLCEKLMVLINTEDKSLLSIVEARLQIQEMCIVVLKLGGINL